MCYQLKAVRGHRLSVSVGCASAEGSQCWRRLHDVVVGSTYSMPIATSCVDFD